jgi:hypothetical protein
VRAQPAATEPAEAGSPDADGELRGASADAEPPPAPSEDVSSDLGLGPAPQYEPEPVHDAAAAAPAPLEAPAPPALEPSAPAHHASPPDPDSWDGEPSRELAPPLYPSASFFTRFEARDGYDRLGVSRDRRLEGEWVAYRARFGLRTAPMPLGEESLAILQFTPQASGVWGELPSTVSDAQLGLHEGYLRLKNPWLELDLGRFVMNYGDALVIGSLDWHETGRSFDGARARFLPGDSGLWIDLLVTQQAEGLTRGEPSERRIENVGHGDEYLMGAYVGLGPGLGGEIELDLYSLAQLWPRTTGVPLDDTDPRTTYVTYSTAVQSTNGLRIKQRVGLLDYRAEGGVQVGHRPSLGGKQTVRAFQADLELGVNLLRDRFRLAVEGLYATGDDPATLLDAEGWDQLYPTAHKWLGLSDIIGPRTNVYGPVGHLQIQLFDDLQLEWQGHVFYRPQRADDADAYAGTEIDTVVRYGLGQGLELRGLWAHYAASGDHYAEEGTANYGELQLGYRFGP